MLFETKVRENNEECIANKMVPNWKFIHNGDRDNPSRIWMGWNQGSLELEVISVSRYLIPTKMTTKSSNITFMCSAIYGAKSQELRRELWAEFDRIQNTSQLAWALLGDFNVVRFQGEKIGGAFLNEEAVEEFNDCLDRSFLTDLTWKGQFLTWSNGRKGRTDV
ncbi:hypothetical protein NE237_015281 [Protea cynaroides]|uniref:Exo_endo_phos domain-containing protein n=1 Tax=Protea cynaroides TaxID=273540 RepID=A0A9Q0QQW9_9MAGN|nr:hypothetical protein NE237_015281 [Protea cynaroides]